MKEKQSFKLPKLDLRPVTREGSDCIIEVDMGDYFREWIHCGRADLIQTDRNMGAVGILKAKAAYNITDFEHDTITIFQIPIVGIELAYVLSGWTAFYCWIGGESNYLRVPTEPGYDPTKLPGATLCKDCKDDKHTIVPEGYYAGPPEDYKLWAHLVGKKLKIKFGPSIDHEKT